VEAVIQQLVGAGEALLSDLENSRLLAADQRSLPDFLAAYDAATTALVMERGRLENHMVAVRNGVAGVADAARFLVALVIPALVVAGALAYASRRQRKLRSEASFLEEENLRQAKDEFLSAIAQELRTPLTGVVGFAEALRDKSRQLSPMEREELVAIVAEEATNTAAVLDDLLVFARANVGDLTVRPQAISVGDLLEQVAMSLGPLKKGHLNISGEGTAWADPMRLRQVVRNLLINAFRHGGDRIELRVWSGEDAVQIQVADNGPAIPPSLRLRMFEPYQHGITDPGSLPSIGLGLTVARTLIQLMNGDVSYSYHEGESSFTVTLPIVVPSPQSQVALGETKVSVTDVLEAIRTQSFAIHYQPIVEIQHVERFKVAGVEALARFASGPPTEWFAVARAAGVGVEVELALIKAAVAGFRAASPDQFITLNTSLDTLVTPRLLEAVQGIKPNRIVFELSEGSVVDNYQRTKAQLDRITSLGYRLAIDDLAGGRIDLWHLVRLRPAIVKFDISLVREIDTDPSRRSLVNALKWLGDLLSCKVVAEGIEQPGELETLRRLGIHYGQGYLLGRPAPIVQDHAAGAHLDRPIQPGPASRESDRHASSQQLLEKVPAGKAATK
jgi:EAL domain-containing protein (putative c-di-GMP-specific phosphodiesterase class I)/signal transduction histidine kinase